MKDQYFGDVNDYCKYGILRLLTDTGLSLGVCWLLTRNDDGVDGERRSYLRKDSRWREYDPDLYDRLQRLHKPGVERSVHHAEEWGLVPQATYFDEVLSDDEKQRDIYFASARQRLRDCDVLFFDPDNGIEVPSVPRGKRHSAKYIYWTELREAYSSGHSLLVYQHFPRVRRRTFVRSHADRLAEELRAHAVRGFATPHVAFFLVSQFAHRDAIARSTAAVLATWQGHIELCTELVETERRQSKETVAKSAPAAFTAKQGQYLAFIYYYTKIHKSAPAEADLKRYFQVSAPTVHQMIVTLTSRGLIQRTPGQARSIRLCVTRAELPDLE